MKAVRFTDPSGNTRIGALDEGGEAVRDAGPSGPQGFVPTAEAWEQIKAATGPEYRVGDIRLLAPVEPRKILAIGLNYRDHAEESNLEIPPVPVVFAILPTALIGPEDTIVVPR